MKAIVEYQVGQFKGLIDVYCNENDDECIIAKARKRLIQMAGG